MWEIELWLSYFCFYAADNGGITQANERRTVCGRDGACAVRWIDVRGWRAEVVHSIPTFTDMSLHSEGSLPSGRTSSVSSRSRYVRGCSRWNASAFRASLSATAAAISNSRVVKVNN
jgi:hypothetical protein